MGTYRKFHFWKKLIESVLIHAVDISTCIHSHNDVVVGPSRVACYGEFEVFSLIEGSPVIINMVNHFKHIYPWWIGLPVSKFINVGVIIILGGLSKLNSLGGSFLSLADTSCTWHSLQDTFSLAGVHVSHISCTCSPSLGVFWTDV